MVLGAKTNNPITLKLSPKENVLITEAGRFPLEEGSVFGGDHYGFKLVVEKAGDLTSTTYPTQCRIYGTQMSNGQLHIFEDHKFIPWRFSEDGTLLSNAVFSDLKRDEWDYIVETYGVETKEDLEELNDYRKPGKR